VRFAVNQRERSWEVLVLVHHTVDGRTPKQPPDTYETPKIIGFHPPTVWTHPKPEAKWPTGWDKDVQIWNGFYFETSSSVGFFKCGNCICLPWLVSIRIRRHQRILVKSHVFYFEEIPSHLRSKCWFVICISFPVWLSWVSMLSFMGVPRSWTEKIPRYFTNTWVFNWKSDAMFPKRNSPTNMVFPQESTGYTTRKKKHKIQWKGTCSFKPAFLSSTC